MRKLTILIALAGLLVFSTFAFTRMEASDGVEYREQIAELQSTVKKQAAKVAELEDELECYEANAEPSEKEEPCSSS